jgi:PGF-CTERM protein
MKSKVVGGIVLVVTLAMVFSVTTGVVGAYVLTADDLEYSEWSIQTGNVIIFYNEKIAKAIEDYDFVSVKRYSKLEYDFVSSALDEIDQFDVTPGYLSLAKEENKAYLQDIKWAVYYTEKFADAILSGDLEDAIEYGELSFSYNKRATEHTEACTRYVLKYIEEPEKESPSITPTPVVAQTPTPKDSDGDGIPDEYDYAPNDPKVRVKEDLQTPGFGVIIAIICVLVGGYLAIRRRK